MRPIGNGVLLIGAGNDLWATLCLGLQPRDRDQVLHGRETGTVKRLPHGEYVEVHQPLSRTRLFTLTQHEQPSPYEIGPGARIPKPTAEEYRALTREGGHH